MSESMNFESVVPGQTNVAWQTNTEIKRLTPNSKNGGTTNYWRHFHWRLLYFWLSHHQKSASNLARILSAAKIQKPGSGHLSVIISLITASSILHPLTKTNCYILVSNLSIGTQKSQESQRSKLYFS